MVSIIIHRMETNIFYSWIMKHKNAKKYVSERRKTDMNGDRTQKKNNSQ